MKFERKQTQEPI